MLGTRGCRLGLGLSRDVRDAGARDRASRARRERADRGGAARRDHASARRLRRGAPAVAGADRGETIEEEGDIDDLCGTMIELPRACIRADEIAEHADFFSFGTNDLTQTTLGLSRDDAEGKFLTYYLEHDVLDQNPFVTIDQVGCRRPDAHRGRARAGRSRTALKLGICGEHRRRAEVGRVLRGSSGSTTSPARPTASRLHVSRRPRRLSPRPAPRSTPPPAAKRPPGSRSPDPERGPQICPFCGCRDSRARRW